MANQKLQLDKMAAAEDLADVIPVVFSWNYIPRLPAFIVPQDWSVELPIDGSDRDYLANSFPIFPKAAGLPYHTGLTCPRHNRFWRPALRYAAELCELFAGDQSYNKANLTRGGTLATIGQRELQKPEGERFVTFAINLFPHADEERMQLIAAGIMFVVTFDDSWEEAPGEALKRVQDDFVARLRGGSPDTSTSPTPLQTRINSFVSRITACDTATRTDGGAVFLSTMLAWVMHAAPTTPSFPSPRAYLDYRWTDAANEWLLAACKFAIASPVPVLGDPRLARLERLVGDHISIVNDLGSFEKERKAFESGRTVVLINLVEVLRGALGLGTDEAKAAGLVMQLLNEEEIRGEVGGLRERGELGREEWRYVDSLLALVAGNAFYTMTTSRYGGEEARIR